MHVFISGPHGEDGDNLPAFERAEQLLKRAGHDPVKAWTNYMPNCLRCGYLDWAGDPLWFSDVLENLSTCEGVALLDGWQRNPGAMLEVGWAFARGLQVLHLGCWLDESWRGWPARAEAQRQVIEEALRAHASRSRSFSAGI